MKRTFVTVFIYIAVSVILFPFAGKPEPPMREVRRYYKADSSVKLEIFSFYNYSPDTNLNYLSKAIPEQIAETIEAMGNIRIASNEVDLTPVNFDKGYTNEVITNTNGNTNFGMLSVFTNMISNIISETNEVYVSLSALKSNAAKTNEKSEALDKDETGQSNLVEIISNKMLMTNVLFITGETEELELRTNESLYNYEGTNVILYGNKDFRRSLIIPQKILVHPGEGIEDLFAGKKTDFFIYGSIRNLNAYSIEITAKIFRKRSGKLYEIKQEMDMDEIGDMLPLFCYEAASRLSETERVYNLKVSTDPIDALLYIDGIHIGKTDVGVVIPSLPVGKHKIVVKKNNYINVEKEIDFKKSMSNVALNFVLTNDTTEGRVMVSVENVSNAEVYIDGLLYGKNSYAETDLAYGTHIVSAKKEGYEVFRGTFNVESQNDYAFEISMKKVREMTRARRIFGNYSRNARIFLISSGILGAVTIAMSTWYSEMRDLVATRFNAINYYYEYTYPDGSVVYVPYLPSLYEQSQVDGFKVMQAAKIAFNTSLGITLGAAFVGGIYYILKIASRDFKVKRISVTPSFSPDGGEIRVSAKF